MAGERIKRKIVWEKTGVSEIIGTILMLSITVVLFSGVITMVGTMPAPKQSFVVDLKCSIHPVNVDNWTQGVDFRILHQGGQVMDNMWIKIYLAVDDTMLVEDVNDGLVDANGNAKWNVGEYWKLFVGNANVTTLDNNSTFSLTIVDQERNTLVWHETLGLQVHTYYPIIKRAWVDVDIATPVDDPGPISFTVPFIMYVEVLDPQNNLNRSSVFVNMGTMYKDGRPYTQLTDTFIDTDGVEYGHLDDNIYLAVCNQPNQTSVGYYDFKFFATNNYNQTSGVFFKFPVGIIVGENPQIVVDSANIRFSNDQPTNGDQVTITATVQNLGYAGSRVNVSFYMNNKTNMIGNLTILVPMSGERDASMDWLASPGGNHTIIVSAWPLDGTEDPSATWDNEANRSIVVMPRILLVDDDGHVNDLSDYDTVSYMRASLESADFVYDFVTVGAGDGPGYDYGDYPLKDYDIVVWMTGYRETGTLTLKDIKQLILFLNGGTNTSSGAQGGSLWLISQGFWRDAKLGGVWGDLDEFAKNYLMVPTSFLMPDAALLNTSLYGNYTNPVTDYFADNPISIGTGDVFHWPTMGVMDKDRIALTNFGESEVYAMTYDSDLDLGNPTRDSRRLTQTWSFARISDTAIQAQYAYKAIMWLGNIEYKFTEDLAISSQTTMPKIVFFKQPVTISFTVRNNGFKVYNPASDRVEYLLRIYDADQNIIKEVYSYLNTTLGIGNNNTVTVNETWTPQTLGYHRIWIMIDPFNMIPESNKLNNMISNYWGMGELNVRYRVLLIDDDGSTNNGGSNHNETLDMIASLDYLGYDYELHNVSVDLDGPAFEAGVNGVGLSEYNAVIWVAGQTDNSLTPNDLLNITSYTEIGGNFWLIGTGIDTIDSGFLSQYFGILSVTADQGTGTELQGVVKDPISHGMEYSMTDDGDADYMVPVAGASGFTQDDSGNYNSVRFQPTSGIPYRAVTTAWLPSNLDVFEQRTEFVFMVLRWFDKPEDRIELRVTNTDISISNDYPQLGSGYVIKVTVQNTGGSTGNVLVRFLDGSTQIGSDSISVSPGGLTTAEIIWVPLFAGQRTIHVLLDPIAEVPEIFEWSNNNASRQIYVYFFWDNMEFGAGKWSHSSTITLINGEGPLEYFGTTAVSVNIEKDWDYTASKYIENCTDPGFYHTFDKATWLQEPAGATTTSRKPLDVVFAIDSSGSMAWDASGNNLPGTYTNPASRWYNARVATIGFIQELTDVDRAIIFTFNNGADFAPLISPANYLYMTATNKQTLINALNGFTNVAGGTPFYDTLGKSVEYAVNNALNVNPTLPNLLSLDRMEFVIGLGDGQSNRDDEWTPNCNWGTTMTDNQWTNGGVNVNGMKGILNAPPIIYTIGVSGIPHDPAYPSAGDDPSWSRTSPAVTYPEEYDMWHCADSSPIILDSAGGKYGESAPGVDNVGHYYFTNDPTQLESVFQNILESIIIQLEGEEQTRSSLPGPSTMATTTYTYAAITSPSATHRAYYCDVDAMPPTGGNLNSQTEATTTEYGQIATSNNVRWTTPNPGNGDEVFMWSEFQIAESPATITQINFNFDGQCNQATDFGIWATNGAWAQVGIVVSAAADTDAVFTRSVSGAGCAAYIIGGVLTWGVYVDYSFDISRIDLLSVDIIWNSSPYIVNTVPANAATNIALTDNIVITFNKEINPTTFSYSVTPDPGGWSTAWNGGFTAVTLSHSNFNESTSYTVTVLSAEDTSSNALIADVIPNPWTFTTTGPPVITMTTPANGAVNVALTSTVVVTFSKAMNTASVTYTCLPLVTVWSVVWSAGNTVATYSHTNSFASNTPYTFRITGGNDGTDPLEAGVIPNPWTFTTAIEIPPTITNTVPVSGATGVALTQLVIVTFSEAMNTGSVGYSISPNPGGLAIAWNNPTNTIATISHNAFTTGGVLYTVTITGLDTTGNALATGAVPNPWSFRTEDYIQPTIISTTPSDGSTGVGTGQPIVIMFSEAMDTASVQAAFGCAPNPGGWTYVWNSLRTELTAKHYDFNQMKSYTCSVSNAAEDASGNSLASTGATNPWSFTTGVGGGSGSTPGLAPDGANVNKSAVTKAMDLRNQEKATLEFWHKYNMVPGANGGILMVGYKESAAGPLKWKYVVPSSAYTGNLRLNITDRVDSYGTFIQWGWNGISGRGTFTWEKVSLNLLNYVPNTIAAGYEWRSNVSVKFQYYQYGGGTGYGWYIDDVRVTVSRPNSAVPDSASQDLWYLTGAQAHSGSYSWGNVDPLTGLMKPGIDNYLMSTPIDLTNAKTAYLSAYVKFNLNFASGAPPDGFRVEITQDNGITWTAVNLGVRSAWNISGTDADWEDGYPGDGKSYTGISDPGDVGTYWVNLGSLTRVNIDLSSFSGNAIQIRFRVITNSDAGYAHSNNVAQGDPDFGGFFVDDVQITGETILTG